MNDIETLFRRLMAGETVDSIADEMTAALNEASRKFQEEEEKRKLAELEAKRAKEAEVSKREEVEEWVRAAGPLIQKHWPEYCAKLSFMAAEDWDRVANEVTTAIIEAMEDKNVFAWSLKPKKLEDPFDKWFKMIM